MDLPKDDLKTVGKNDAVGDSDRTTILSVSNILRTLANDHQNNIILRENALLRQEIQQMRIELSELRMENLRIKSEALENEQRHDDLQIFSEVPITNNIEKQKMEYLNLNYEKPFAYEAIAERKIEEIKSEKDILDSHKDIVEQKTENQETELNNRKAIMKSIMENQEYEMPSTSKAVMKPNMENTCIQNELKIPNTDKVFIDTVNAKSTQEIEQDFKKYLIENIQNYLNYQEQKVVVNFKMFECIFSCFSNNTDFMQQMKHFDVKFNVILNNRFHYLYQNHILVMNQRIHQVEQQRRQKLFEHFRTGMQMENWAQRLEMQLSSMKLISELRNVVLKLAAKKDRNALLQAIQNIENKLKKDD